MNNDESFTTEFFENETKRRKQIPIAVFTIVAAHVALFAGLLGAAGCKKDPAAAAIDDKDNAAKKIATAEYQSQPAVPETASTAPTGGSVSKEPVQYGPLEKVSVTEAAEPVSSIKTAPPVAAKKSAVVAAKPATVKAPAAIPAPLLESTDNYVVKSGDSLEKIARLYGTTAKAIKTSNHLKNDLIRVGQKLKITNNKARQA